MKNICVAILTLIFLLVSIGISGDDRRGWINAVLISTTDAKPIMAAVKPPEALTMVDAPPSSGVGIFETSPAKEHKAVAISVKSEPEKQPTAKLGVAMIFLVITVIWLLLPLIPSIRELMKPTDIDPLRVVPRDSSAVSFFANNFRNYILSQVEKYDFSSLRDYEPARLSDGTPFVRAQGSGNYPLKETSSANAVDHVVIAGAGSILPDDTTFLREVYGVASLMGGSNCVYRAVLAEGELTLRPGSMILRWGHSVGVFTVHEDSILYGRASSDKELHLTPGVTFEWIAAPLISVESVEEHIDTPKEKVQCTPFVLDDMIKLTDETYRYNGDLLIPDRSSFIGNLVVKGWLMISPETCIRGSLKSDGEITLGDGCIVEGGVVTSSPVTIGKNCILWGPIISEKQITVGHGSIVGTKDKPATISAPLVNLHSGVAVTGMVVAQSAGKTLL